MLNYAIMIMIVGAFASLVGGWIKGPNWPRTVLIGLFLTLIGAAAVLMYVQSSSQSNDTSSSIATPTRITSSNEETATGQPQPTETPYTADEGTATGRPQPTETPYTADEGTATRRPQPTETPYTEGRSIHATDLQVGDCYNNTDTGNTGSDGERQVDNVEVVDCDVPHQHEVYNNYQITLSTFPDKSTMHKETQTACRDPFKTYVGVAYEKSMYGVMVLTPTEASWAEGDRTITCTLESKDDSLITGSLKGAAK